MIIGDMITGEGKSAAKLKPKEGEKEMGRTPAEMSAADERERLKYRAELGAQVKAERAALEAKTIEGIKQSIADEDASVPPQQNIA